MSNLTKFLILGLVALAAGIKLHVESVELAIGSRYEGCHEATLALGNVGLVTEANYVEAMCVERDKEVREYVK